MTKQLYKVMLDRVQRELKSASAYLKELIPDTIPKDKMEKLSVIQIELKIMIDKIKELNNT